MAVISKKQIKPKETPLILGIINEAKKVVRPKPDQPDRLRRPCISRSTCMGVSGPSLLIESTDSMIYTEFYKHAPST